MITPQDKLHQIQLWRLLIADGNLEDPKDSMLDEYKTYGFDYQIVSAQGTRIKNGKNLNGMLSFGEASAETAKAAYALNEQLNDAEKKLKKLLATSSDFDSKDLEPANSSPASGNGSAQQPQPAMHTSFNITAFIARIDQSGDNFDTDGLSFPDQDSTLVMDFIFKIQDEWDRLVRARKYGLIFKYLQTLRSLSGDAELELEILDEMTGLNKKLRFGKIEEPKWKTDMASLVEDAKTHIARLLAQEEAIADGGFAEETLTQRHIRIKGQTAESTHWAQYSSLAAAVLAKVPSSSLPAKTKTIFKTQFASEVTGPLERLKTLTGYNLKSKLSELIDGPLGRAITAVEKQGGAFGRLPKPQNSFSFNPNYLLRECKAVRLFRCGLSLYVKLPHPLIPLPERGTEVLIAPPSVPLGSGERRSMLIILALGYLATAKNYCGFTVLSYLCLL